MCDWRKYYFLCGMLPISTHWCWRFVGLIHLDTLFVDYQCLITIHINIEDPKKCKKCMTSYLSCVKHILIKGVPKRLNFYLGVPREGIVVALASIKKNTYNHHVDCEHNMLLSVVPQFGIAKLAQITPVTFFYGRYIYSYYGVKFTNLYWLVVWNMFCSIYWEFHHPNWRTHMFQRGRSTTNQYKYGGTTTL